MSSKIKQNSASNKRRTQAVTISAFDQSIVFVVVTKIQKCLYEISKSKLSNLQESLKAISKDITVISSQCKDRQKVSILEMHLQVFELINDKKYDQALGTINRKLKDMSERGNPILRLSVDLGKSLLLRFLQKQSQSQRVLCEGISQLDLGKLKIRSKSLDYRILQSTIICISIIADYFNRFQSHSPQFRSIYAQAYRISHKYLTQYHKLTETLYTICKKFPVKESNTWLSESLSNSNYKRKSSIGIDSNLSGIKNPNSDRLFVDHSSSRVKSIVTHTHGLELKHNTKKTKPTKRLKTLDPYIDLQQSKQKSLSKLYGMELSQLKLKSKNSIKRPRYSTSLKTQQQQQTHQLKQLDSIYQIYLPKISNKKSYQEKLNAAEVLKYGSSLEKLKPNYFDKLSAIRNKRDSPAKKGLNTPPVHQKNNHVVEKNVKTENRKKSATETPPIKEIKNNKQEKQKPLPAIITQQVPQKKDQVGCQLI